MKVVILAFISCSVALTQTQTGSVAVYFFSQNEITVAADSRVVFGGDGKRYADTSCKIRAFSDKFFVVLTGMTVGKNGDSPEWSAYNEARNAWLKADHVAGELSPQRLTYTVAQDWADVMESHLNNQVAINAARSSLWGGSVVVSAFFGATDKQGNLGAFVANIMLNVPLYDRRKIIELSRHFQDLHEGDEGAMGLSEIATEFHYMTSDRAKKLMTTYLSGISKLSPQKQESVKAIKLIQLSIELHPQKKFLGPPVDELQLVRGKTISWPALKPSCKKQE